MSPKITKRVEVPTYEAAIYIAGDVWEAETICLEFCDRVGECVNVSEAAYCYTKGEARGVRVGFINYPRFPREPGEIFERAEALALELIERLGQDSCSIVATDKTVWLSRRKD